jgi:hypothetical protein
MYNTIHTINLKMSVWSIRLFVTIECLERNPYWHLDKQLFIKAENLTIIRASNILGIV